MFNELPHSLDAEQTVIGALIVDGLKTERVMQSFEKLKATDFYSGSHKTIFEAITQMHDDRSVIEIVSVVSKLPSHKAYIVELAMNCPGTGTIDFYADIVINHAKERRMIEAFRCAMNILTETKKHSDKMDEVAALMKFEDVDGTDSEAELITEILERHMNVLQERMDRKTVAGYETGFIELDNTLGGMGKGRLYVLGARPSVGKSVLGLNIANAVSKKYQAQTSYISLEMEKGELADRLLCANGSVNSRTITSMQGVDFAALQVATTKLKDLSLRIRIMTRPKIEQIKNFARALKRRGQLDFLVIDHLHLMGYTGTNEVQGLASISGELKSLALELDIPILLLAQLNRGNAKENRMPAVTDLRGSGAIEQDADCVMLLHRDEELDEHGKALLLIRKNRNGENNKIIDLHQNLQFYRFDNAAYAHQEEAY